MFKNLFNKKLTNGKNANEIECFRALEECIRQESYVQCEEMHSHPGMVKHKLAHSHNAPEIRRCEIADLLLIYYNDAGNIRYTFMQNKRDKYTMLSNIQKIKATPIQWDLLHYKAKLETSSSSIPLNVLSSAILDSVGTYGVFLNDVNNDVDMVYLVAKDMDVDAAYKIKNSTKKTFDVDVEYDHIYNYSGYNEIRAVCGLDKFYVAGKSMLIGTPIDLNLSNFNIDITSMLGGVLSSINEDDKRKYPYLKKFIFHSMRYISNMRNRQLKLSDMADESIISKHIDVAIVRAYTTKYFLTQIDSGSIQFIKQFFGNDIKIQYENYINIMVDNNCLIICDSMILDDEIRMYLSLTRRDNIFILKKNIDSYYFCRFDLNEQY